MPAVIPPPPASELVDETRIGIEGPWLVVELQTEDGASSVFKMHPKQAHAFSDQLLLGVAEHLRREGAQADMSVPERRPLTDGG